jgi:ubiquinone/menaquinone biosynthesis C-methylase UbiE
MVKHQRKWIIVDIDSALIWNQLMDMSTYLKKYVRFCESEFGKKIMQREAEYIYSELKDCETILDVGCGIGSFEQNLPNLNIIGLDISEEMLEEARKRIDKTFFQGNVEDLKFEDSTSMLFSL